MPVHIQITKNYDLFKLHPINRTIQDGTHSFLELEASLLKDGWWEFEPMVVYPIDKDGKYTILKGHHRWQIARKHGIPVKFIVDEKRTPIWMTEAPIGRDPWSLSDWISSYVREGSNPNYQVLQDYQERTGIPMSTCIWLFTIGTERKVSHWGEEIRKGTFRFRNTILAETVEGIINLCATLEIKYARKTGFVRATALIVRANILNVNVLKDRIRKGVVIMKKMQPTTDYVAILNEVVNYRVTPKIDVATAIRNAMDEEKREILLKGSKTARENRIARAKEKELEKVG